MDQDKLLNEIFPRDESPTVYEVQKEYTCTVCNKHVGSEEAACEVYVQHEGRQMFRPLHIACAKANLLEKIENGEHQCHESYRDQMIAGLRG